MPVDGGTAVFRAVAQFGPLISESRRAQGALQGVDGAAEGALGSRFQQRVQARGKDMAKLGGKMTRSVSLPLAAIGAVAIHTFAEFEAAIAQAGLKAGATGKDLDAMKRTALEVGKATAFSATEAAGALNDLAAQGFNAKESIAALPGVTNAAQASQSDLGLTAKIVGSSIKAFNLQATDSARVADTLASAANNSAIDMQGLGDALAHAGELGATSNQSLEDVVATVSRLVDLGVPAASAGVAVRQMMKGLQNPTQKSFHLMEAFGIEVKNSKGEMLPMAQVLERVRTSLQKGAPAYDAFVKSQGKSTKATLAFKDAAGLSNSQYAELLARFKKGGKVGADYVASILTGVEGQKAFNLLTKDTKPLMIDSQKETAKMDRLYRGLAETMGKKGAKAWIKQRTESGKFVAKSEDIITAQSAISRGSKGLSKRMAEAFQKTTKQKIDNMKGSLETLAITVITDLKPAIDGIISGLAKFFGWLSDLASSSPVTTRVVAALAVAIGLIGPALWIAGKAMALFAAETETASAGLLANPIFWVVAALAALVIGLVYAYEHSKKFHKIVDAAMHAVGKAFAWLWVQAQPVLKAIGEGFVWLWRKALQPAFKWIGDHWKLLVAGFLIALGPLGWVALFVAAKFGLIKKIIGAVIGFIIKNWKGLLTTFLLIIGPLGWLVLFIWKKFGFVKSLVMGVVHFIGKHWKALGAIFLVLLGPIGWVVLAVIKNFTKLKKAVGKLAGPFHAAVDAIGKVWDKIKEKMAGPIRWVINTVINKGLIDAINWLLGKLGFKSKIPHVGGIGDSSSNKSGPNKTSGKARNSTGGFFDGGWTGRGGKYQPAGEVHGDEHVIRKAARRRMERRHPGWLNHVNTYGEVPGYASGGRVWPSKSKHWTTYPGHDGIDLNGPGNGMGDPYFATEAGRVAYTGWGRGYGDKLELATKSGPTVIYGHSSKILAHAGSIVRAGQMIGRIGSTGHSTGPHLHFGLKGEGPDMGALAIKYLGGAKIAGHGGGGGFGFDFDPIGWAKKRLGGLKAGAARIGGLGGKIAQGATSFAGSAFMKTVKRLATATLKKGSEVLDWIPNAIPGAGAVKGVGKIASALFDNGGLLPPGRHLVENKSQKPEAVLTGPQWASLMSSIERGQIPKDMAQFIRRPQDAAANAAQIVKVYAQQFTWNVYNPVREKTSASTLKTLTKKAHGGLDG